MTRPICVYHVAAMGDWRDVVREQLGTLADAGFGADSADPVRVTFVGTGLEWFAEEAARFGVHVVIVRADENVNHYETFAVLEVERLAKSERVTRPVLYLHTKGVSSAGDLHKRRWRLLMEEHVVRRWEACVARLQEGYDAAGCGWWTHGEQHFSGNFWIASADWLRKLPDYVNYHHAKGLSRYSCEMWIGAHQWCRAYECFANNQQFWQGWYDFTGHTAALTSLPAAPTADMAPDVRPVLAVVTAVSRPDMLGAVGYSLAPLQQFFRLRWVLVADTGRTTPADVANAVPAFLRECIQVFGCPGAGDGIAQKNCALDYLTAHFPEAWLYVLDDDNAVHPAFPEAAAGAVWHFGTAGAVVFGQANADGSHRLDAGPVQWGKIDAASSLVRADFVGPARFRPHPGAIGDDFQFIRQLWDRAPERFRFVHRRCTYYNKLPRGWLFSKYCPVPIHQEFSEFQRLVGEVSLNQCDRIGTIVEIGSLYGGTLWHWINMWLVERVLSIDLPPKPADPWFCPVLHGAYLEACRALWPEWAAKRHCQFKAITGDSHDPATRTAAVQWLGGLGTVDFLWIDGDHSTEGALADFRDYSPLVKPGGMIGFHDIHKLPEVAAAWAEIKRGRRWTEYGSPGGWGIGIIHVEEGAKP